MRCELLLWHDGLGLPTGHRVIEYAYEIRHDGRERMPWVAACGAGSTATVLFDPAARPTDPESLCTRGCWPAGPDVIYPRPINESEVA